MSLLTPPDEYFNHQIAFPHAVVGTSDPSWRERYWFSIQDTASRDVVMTCGMGHYPNQNVQEAFVVLSTGGKQRNLRLSRSLLPESHVTRVGPFTIEVVEPLRRLHLVLDENPSGLGFDIEWSGTMEPLLEGRHFEMSRARVKHDLVRYVQVGRAAGDLRAPGHTFTLDPASWWGERDHSWGLRPLPRVEGAPPGERPAWRMLMFCPIQFEDFGVHIYLYEAEPGRALHLSAGLLRPPGTKGDEEIIESVHHELRWVEGAPAVTLEGGRLELGLASGEHLEIDLVAQPGRAHLRGGGYEGTNGWFQGHWKGDDSLEHETWDLTDASSFRHYAKASSDHLVEARCRGETGFGVMEYMVLPGYAQYPGARPAR